jgi:hypothetical protein
LGAEVPEFDDPRGYQQTSLDSLSLATHPSADPPDAITFLSDFNANKLVTDFTALLYSNQPSIPLANHLNSPP